MPKFWTGEPPKRCGICKGLINGAFVDGATSSGVWAYMCRVCHHLYGVGLGTGKGQMYTQSGRVWVRSDELPTPSLSKWLVK